jgi:hypothetical protein
MLKRTITFEDFDGNQVTETYFFNLSKSELIELEADYKDGLNETLQKIVNANDAKQIIALFKRIVLLAYGKKSEDGKRFIKNQELCDEFVQTPAYDALFMELATDADKAGDFIKSVVPKDMAATIDEAEKARVAQAPTPQLPPPPPTHVDL